MRSPARHGYSVLPVEQLIQLGERMFTAKNYVLAAALLDAATDSLSPAQKAKLRYSHSHGHQEDPRFLNTAAILPILSKGYSGETVATVLGVSLKESKDSSEQRLLQVLFRPSFDPEQASCFSLHPAVAQ